MKKLSFHGYKTVEFEKTRQEDPEMDWREIKRKLREFLGFVYVDKNDNVVIDMKNPQIKADLAKEINNESVFAIKRRERIIKDKGPIKKIMQTLLLEQKPGDPRFLEAIQASWHKYRDKEFGGHIIYPTALIDDEGHVIDSLLTDKEAQ